MTNNIKYTSIFEKYLKRYLKKHRSLKNDLKGLEAELLANPKLGTDLGDNLYKIRLAVKSKNTGKSGGYRVVTYLLKPNNNELDINLLIIYDKSDIDDIPKTELQKIVREIFE